MEADSHSAVQIVRSLEVIRTESEFEKTVVKALIDLARVQHEHHKATINALLDVKKSVDNVTVIGQTALGTAQDARNIALRAEGAADMAQSRVGRMRAALDTLPESVELEKIAREAGKAAGFDVAEEITERFRRAPIPSDPVRAIVDRRIEERSRDAIVARVAWWQSAAFGWAAKIGAAGAGYVGLRLLEELARHWH